ncbi:hypothetical protein SEA_WENTWORTH_11 [Streptomyces phage Wentworth]|nr:hypothetical protein SEA_WENTWORTH_11 [Streptomyces phage Wentworth]
MATLTATEGAALQSAAVNGTPSTVVNLSGMSTEQRNSLNSACSKLGIYVDQIDASRIAVSSVLFQLLVNQTV